MAHIDNAGPSPSMRSTQGVRENVNETAPDADVLLLQAWETNRSMHLGTMLRIQQILRASRQQAAKSTVKLTPRRGAVRIKT